MAFKIKKKQDCRLYVVEVDAAGATLWHVILPELMRRVAGKTES